MNFTHNSKANIHKKTTSHCVCIKNRGKPHKRGFSLTISNSVEPFLKPKTVLKHSEGNFLAVIDSALNYFSQNNTIIEEDTQKFRIMKLEQERERMKIENSKLQIALAQAKAKSIGYKAKIRSLKNYCKILEVGRFTQTSKEIFMEGVAGPRKSKQSKKVMSDKSSDTEFEFTDTVFNLSLR